MGGSLPGATYCRGLLFYDSGHVSSEPSNGMYALPLLTLKDGFPITDRPYF